MVQGQRPSGADRNPQVLEHRNTGKSDLPKFNWEGRAPWVKLDVFKHLESLTEEVHTTARSSAYAIIQMEASRSMRGVCDGKAGDGKSDQTMEKASVNRNGDRTDPEIKNARTISVRMLAKKYPQSMKA